MPNLLLPQRVQQQLLQETTTCPRQIKLKQMQKADGIQNKSVKMGEQTKFRLRGDNNKAAFPQPPKQSSPPNPETKLKNKSTQYKRNIQFRQRKREPQKQQLTNPLTIERSIPEGLRTNPEEGESFHDNKNPTVKTRQTRRPPPTREANFLRAR